MAWLFADWNTYRDKGLSHGWVRFFEYSYCHLSLNLLSSNHKVSKFVVWCSRWSRLVQGAFDTTSTSPYFIIFVVFGARPALTSLCRVSSLF